MKNTTVRFVGQVFFCLHPSFVAKSVETNARKTSMHQDGVAGFCKTMQHLGALDLGSKCLAQVLAPSLTGCDTFVPHLNPLPQFPHQKTRIVKSLPPGVVERSTCDNADEGMRGDWGAVNTQETLHYDTNRLPRVSRHLK